MWRVSGCFWSRNLYWNSRVSPCVSDRISSLIHTCISERSLVLQIVWTTLLYSAIFRLWWQGLVEGKNTLLTTKVKQWTPCERQWTPCYSVFKLRLQNSSSQHPLSCWLAWGQCHKRKSPKLRLNHYTFTLYLNRIGAFIQLNVQTARKRINLVEHWCESVPSTNQ